MLPSQCGHHSCFWLWKQWVWTPPQSQKMFEKHIFWFILLLNWFTYLASECSLKHDHFFRCFDAKAPSFNHQAFQPYVAGLPDGIFSLQKYTKHLNLFYLGKPWKGKVWKICVKFGLFCGHLACFAEICYIFAILASCTKKNLATLLCRPMHVLSFD
jgi:hypothetical protein